MIIIFFFIKKLLFWCLEWIGLDKSLNLKYIEGGNKGRGIEGGNKGRGE